jgi:hypothetical protein
VDAYFRMELYSLIWLNYGHRDVGVVNIIAVDAYSKVKVCMPIFLSHKLF